jgi:hypothetical protein
MPADADGQKASESLFATLALVTQKVVPSANQDVWDHLLVAGISFQSVPLPE